MGTPINRLMFGITIFMFLLSTCYWWVSVINIALKIRRVVYLNDLITWESVFPLFNAVVYINVGKSAQNILFNYTNVTI